MNRLLVVDDDRASARTLQLHLQSQGFDTRVAYDAGHALSEARDMLPDLVILDIRMPGRSGLDILPELRQIDPTPAVIMITAFHDMDTTIEAMQKGAQDYIHKPVDIHELDAAVARALGPREDDTVPTRESCAGPYEMIGHSHAMREVFKQIGLVARGQAGVLVTGESGTGKELVARAIHNAGTDAGGPFVAVNCAAVVESLLESDLFGHEKGAFTGAVSRQSGKFELASGGTIFLDEIAEMSHAMQAKLLRVLQYKEYSPLGSKRVRQADARIIAATNVDLRESVSRGEFREDLYYRLRVVTLHLPPLRERLEDIEDLVHALLGRINAQAHDPITSIDRVVLERFSAYPWPGNVRELENVLMKAVALSAGNRLTLELLPPEIAGAESADVGTTVGPPPSGLLTLADMEREHVRRVLEATGWHRGKACEILDVSRPRLRRMMREYGMREACEGDAAD